MGYKKLITYQQSEEIYDLTKKFCDCYISKFSRTHDQMVQAARSGKQNIAEGASQQTSLKFYIKEIGISRGSLEELLEDYFDFARDHGIRIWERGDERIERLKRAAKEERMAFLFPSPKPPADRLSLTINYMVDLIKRTNYLLDKQRQGLEEKFANEGGYTENLFKKRLQRRSSFKTFLPFLTFLTLATLFTFFSPNPAKAANINFSLEAWIKPTTSIATKAILVKNSEIRLVTDASGYLVCQIHNGTAWQTAANSGAAIELNKWSQAGCSYDGLNLKVYINGALKSTTAMTENVQNTTNSFFAGKDAGGTYGRFIGTMDSIAIYKDALTAQEFADHYSRGNLYKDENNNLKFEIGGLNLSYDVSSWIDGGWHMITALWNPDGINQVSGSSMLYGNLFVDGASAATSSTAFTTASSLPSTFYFAQDSQSNGQFGGTVYGLQVDENNWKAADITTAYNSGTGIAPVASGKTNFTLSTASSTDVVAWQHSGSLANDGNFEDGDAADWSGDDEGSILNHNGNVELGNTNGWNSWFNAANGAAGSISADNTVFYAGSYSLKTNITNDGTELWDIGIYNIGNGAGFTIIANALYKLSFYIKANASTNSAYVSIIKKTSPYTNAGLNTSLSISTDWVLKEYYFTCTNGYTLDAEISFLFGNLGLSQIWIDNISLREVHTTSAQGGYVKDEQNLAGGWNFETAADTADATDVTGNNDLTWNNISSADYVEGKFGKAIDFNGTDEYLSQTNVYTQADDDGEVTGVLTDGSATVIINDASNLSTAYDLSAGVNNYMIVMTDSASQVAWGYLGTNSFSTPYNTYEIYSTRTGNTQNYAAKGTFSFSNTPITYQIRRSDFQITGAMTVGAWVKPNDTNGKIIIAKRDNLNYAYELSLADDANGNKLLGRINSNSFSCISSVSIQENIWTFVAMTYDMNAGGTEELKTYINGIKDGSFDYSVVPADIETALTVGKRSYTGAEGYFSGLIDSPFIYSSALGGDEIRAMYERGYSDHYGVKIRLSADDAQSYINSNASLSNGGNYLLSFDYRLGEENINPINFTIRDGSGENTAEKNVLGSSVTGLAGAWNFEESATPAVDLSGNSNSGTWTNGATYSNSGKFGKAISLDGSDDKLLITDSSSLDGMSALSLSAWIYADETSNSNNNAGSQLIISKSGVSYWLQLNGSGSGNQGKIHFYSDLTGTDCMSGYTQAISASTWYHISGTYDGSNCKIYLNGTQENSSSGSGNIINGAGKLVIGDNQESVNDYNFNGLIDSVRIYNRALSPEEVYESYKKGMWHKYELSFEADEAATHLFRFIQNGATSGDSILYVDNFDLQTNLADNGGMEGTYTASVAAGWAEAGSTATPSESASSHEGAKAQAVLAGDTSNNVAQTVTVTSGSWYTLKAFGKVDSGNAFIELSGAATKTFTISNTQYPISPSQYTFKAGSPSLVIELYADSGKTGTFDDISVVALGSNSATVAASTAAFTPAFGYRQGKVSGENALPITLSDDLRFDEGGQMGTGSAELAYENFDPFGGTIKAWVKPHWDGTDTGTHVILEDKNGTDYFKLYYSNGNLYFDVYVSSTTYRTYQSVSSWTAGTWYHVTATWSNQNTVNADATGYISNLYINGSDSGNTYSNVTAGTNFWTAFAPGTIYIGESSTPNNRWSGLISGLQVLNYPWSESSVSSDYNSGTGTLSSADANTIFYLPANSADADGMIRWHLKNYREVTANESGLVGGWNFESAATDVTGTYTGTWTGSAAYSAGKNGNAADFDGSTDYIDLGDISF